MNIEDLRRPCHAPLMKIWEQDAWVWEPACPGRHPRCVGPRVPTRQELIDTLPLEEVAGYLSAIEWIPARVHPETMLAALHKAFNLALLDEDDA